MGRVRDVVQDRVINISFLVRTLLSIEKIRVLLSET